MKASQLTKENITPEIVDKLLFEGLDYKGEDFPATSNFIP